MVAVTQKMKQFGFRSYSHEHLTELQQLCTIFRLLVDVISGSWRSRKRPNTWSADQLPLNAHSHCAHCRIESLLILAQ